MEWWQIKEDILKPLGGILVAPYLLVREIKQQVDKDTYASGRQSRGNGRVN